MARSLHGGAAIGATDLADLAAASGITLSVGDAVLIRIGWIDSLHGNPSVYFEAEPGIDESDALWLAEHVARRRRQFRYRGDTICSRQRALVEGLLLAELASIGTSEFLFVATPLPIGQRPSS